MPFTGLSNILGTLLCVRLGFVCQCVGAHILQHTMGSSVVDITVWAGAHVCNTPGDQWATSGVICKAH